MQQSTLVWPWQAKVLALACLAAIEWVVFGDVINHGAPITYYHANTQVILLGTVYIGKMVPEQFRVGKPIVAIMLAVTFVLGTSYLWSVGLSRNGEIEESKGNDARDHNNGRARALAELKKADTAREEAHARFLDAVEAQKIAAKATPTACLGGVGTACLAARNAESKADARVTAAEAAHTKASDAYYQLYGKVSGLKPEKVVDGSVKYLAGILMAVPYFTATKDQMEARVRMYLQGTMTMFSEVVFLLSCAIRTRRRPSRFLRFAAFVRSLRSRRIDAGATEAKAPLALPPATPSGSRTEPTELNGASRARGPSRQAPAGKMGKVEAETFILDQLAAGVRIYGQDDLAVQCGVSESTMHDWLKDMAERKLIAKSRIGKRNAIVAVV